MKKLNNKKLIYIFLIFFWGYDFLFVPFYDVFEHINTTWLISKGYLPYRDFFQNHNPLLWWVSLPFIPIFEYLNSAIILYFFRGIGFGCFLLCIYWLLKLCKEFKFPVSQNTLFFFIGFNPLIYRHLTFSPDNPLVLFTIIGLYYYMKWKETDRTKELSVSFFSFFIGFMFLQKMLFLAIPLFAFILFDILDGRLKIKNFVIASIPSIIGITSFIAYLVCTQSFNSYLENNVILNYLINGFKLEPGLELIDFIYLITLCSSCIFVLLKKVNSSFNFFNIISLLTFIITISFGVPFLYYLELSIFLMTPSFVYVLNFFITKRYLKYIAFLLGGIAVLETLLVPCIFVPYKLKVNALEQYKTAQYVLDNVPKGEKVFNGDINCFSLFHENFHPYWHNLSLNGFKSKELYWGLSFDEVRKQIKKEKPYIFFAYYPPTSKKTEQDFSNWSVFSIKLDKEILEMYEKEPEFGFYIRKK